MSAIEALYIFDEHNNPLLEHVYTGRPPAASTLLPLYLVHPSPRPPLIYLPSLNPPTLVYSIIADRLLFIVPSSTDVEPLVVLEFLHRVVDALEDFLGSPLLASKIEASYDVVAQVLGEMCDGGLIKDTEPNALRETVEIQSLTNRIVAGLGLPGAPPALGSNSTGFGSGGTRPQLPRQTTPNPSPVPWRRANVRHTSNEMYVDIVETLNVTIAPSGRPLAALAAGTIAFTAKVSGVPDLILNLGAPGGISNSLILPVFHPCVRLSRWREKAGELSFVPPDGRFVLAGYEVDLLGADYLSHATNSKAPSSGLGNLTLPATLDLRTNLGPTGAEFEARLTLSNRFRSAQSSSAASSGPIIPGSRPGIRSKDSGTSAAPILEDVVVRVPMTAAIRNVSDMKPSRGEAHFSAAESGLEWRIRGKDVATILASGASTATLRCAVVGYNDESEANSSAVTFDSGNKWDYDEGGDDANGYQTADTATKSASNGISNSDAQEETSDERKVRQNAVLMPSSATISFSVKGWLASGIKVDSLNVDSRKSKGLGAGVTPYKGVKYLTVSNNGVEVRC